MNLTASTSHQQGISNHSQPPTRDRMHCMKSIHLPRTLLAAAILAWISVWSPSAASQDAGPAEILDYAQQCKAWLPRVQTLDGSRDDAVGLRYDAWDKLAAIAARRGDRAQSVHAIRQLELAGRALMDNHQPQANPEPGAVFAWARLGDFDRALQLLARAEDDITRIEFTAELGLALIESGQLESGSKRMQEAGDQLLIYRSELDAAWRDETDYLWWSWVDSLLRSGAIKPATALALRAPTPAAKAECLARLATSAWHFGERERAKELMTQAERLLEKACTLAQIDANQKPNFGLAAEQEEDSGIINRDAARVEFAGYAGIIGDWDKALLWTQAMEGKSLQWLAKSTALEGFGLGGHRELAKKMWELLIQPREELTQYDTAWDAYNLALAGVRAGLEVEVLKWADTLDLPAARAMAYLGIADARTARSGGQLR